MSKPTRVVERLQLLLVVMMLPIVAHGQFTFTTNNGAITITRYTGQGGIVVIPDTTNGWPVKNIGSSAFSSCRTLTGVAIGTNVTGIGTFVFDGCTELTNILVDPSNPSFSSLDGVLFNKAQTTLLNFPGGKLAPYTIPASVTYIGYAAFRLCRISGLTIPDTVSRLGVYAFEFCGSLTNITIGSGVTTILDYAFTGCDSLTNIAVDPRNNWFTSVDGVLLDKTGATLIAYPPGRAGGYTAPAGLRVIGGGAFDGCTNLTSITLPDGFTTVGASAFVDCFGLTNVILPPGLRNIGNQAFSYCDHLPSIVIPASVTNIGGTAFEWCYTLGAVYFQGDAPAVASDAFNGSGGVVYYLPGTSGWLPTCGGLPTALWFLPKPLILNNSSLGVHTNGFGFLVSWATNLSVVVEACTNPAGSSWVSVSTNALTTNGWFYFSDLQWTGYPARFYRVRSP